MEKTILILAFFFFSIVTAEEALVQSTNTERTMNDIKFKYMNIMKRDSYYGNKWFKETSDSFDMVWKRYPQKKKLLSLSNNHLDIAKFIAYFHINSDPDAPLDNDDNLNIWFKNPIAFLGDKTPYDVLRKNTDELESLKFLLQQSLEPPYLPYGGRDTNSNNEEEKALNNELKMLLLKKGLKLQNRTHIGMVTGSNNQDTYIIFNSSWEIWYTERGSWDLVFFTENHEELINYILQNYINKS